MDRPLQLGQIVWAAMADANGIRKERPAIVVTPTAEIAASPLLTVLAITSRLPQPLPDDHVLLPWHPQKHPRTGLNRQCAAVCSWVAQIAPADIRGVAGLTPVAVLTTILSKIAALQPPPPPVPKTGDDQSSQETGKP